MSSDFAGQGDSKELQELDYEYIIQHKVDFGIYRIHTDAIKENLIPPELTARQVSLVYANVSQLVCLSNLENLNAVFINEGLSQAERLAKLNSIAISQMSVLTGDHRILQLESAEDKQQYTRIYRPL